MAEVADIGIGAGLSVNDGISMAQTPFTNLTKVTTPNVEVTMLESPHLDQGDRYMRFTPGLKVPGEITFEQQYSEANYSRCASLAGVIKTYEVPHPGSLTESGSGILMSFPVDFDTNAIGIIKGKVKLTGAITVS